MKIEKQIQNLIINDYLNNNITIKQLSIKYNVSDYFINIIFKENNIKRPGSGNWRTTLLDTNKNDILDMFNRGMNFKDIAKVFNCAENTIANHLKSLGIEARPQTLLQRKYNINENFFENIDNWGLEQAYFLGWLLSDGYLNENRGSISISLQEGDIDVLNKLKNMIGYEGKLLFRKGEKMKWYKNKNYIQQPQYKLHITNKKISQDLQKLTSFKNKSFDLKFPDFLNERLISAFLLGFWEGDGCLFYKDSKIPNPYISIVTTEPMCIGIQDILRQQGISSIIKSPKQYKNNTKVLHLSGTINVLKFLYFIFEKAPCVLNRKFNKFSNFIKLLKEKDNYRDEKLKDQTAKEVLKCELLIDSLSKKFGPM